MECHRYITYYTYVSGTIHAEYGSSAPVSVHAVTYENGRVYLLEFDIMYALSVSGSSPNAAYTFVRSFSLSNPDLSVNPFSPSSGSPLSEIHAIMIQATQMMVLIGTYVHRYGMSTWSWTNHGAVYCPP